MQKIVFPEGIDCVIAFDVGTHRSGIGFCHKRRNKIIIERNYKESEQYKDLSAVLYDNLAPEYWGTAATNKVKDDKYLITDFKMDLLETEEPSSFPISKIGNKDSECPYKIFKKIKDREFNVLEVIADLLVMMRNYAVERIIKMVDKEYFDLNRTRFVVTIPAIWSDKMKDMMLWACNKAKIGPKHCEKDCIHFTFALEPECGALASMEDIEFPIGKCLGIADLGGGTIDFVAVELLESNRFALLSEPTGAAAGGIYVDQLFYDYFFKLVGSNDPSLRQCSEFYRLKSNWYLAKHNFEGDNSVTVDINEYNRFLVTKNIKPIDVKNGTLVLGQNLMTQFFKKSVSEIEKSICLLLENSTKKIETLVMVGGYADSEHVRKCLKASDKLKGLEIISIENSGQAIIRGGVLFGMDSNLFQSRTTKCTYGIGVITPFNENIHDQNRKFTNTFNGNVYCSNFFQSIVLEKTTVNINDPKTYPLCIFRGVEGNSFTFYFVKGKVPMYLDTCQKLVTITVPKELFQDSKGNWKLQEDKLDAEVFLYFGYLHLKMEVKILGKVYEASPVWPKESGFLN